MNATQEDAVKLHIECDRLNALYEEAFGNRPFFLGMTMSDHAALTTKLQIYWIEKCKEAAGTKP